MEKGQKQLSRDVNAMKIFRDCIMQNHTDLQIQTILKNECGHDWSLSTIQRQRRKIGVKKSPGQKIDLSTLEHPILSSPPYGISSTEKADWFRSQFLKSHLYTNLLQQFTQDEVKTYIEDYGNLCCQFEDIVISEFFQIDDFLKHRLLIDRQLVLAKLINEEISNLQKWLINNIKTGNESEAIKATRVDCQLQLNDKYKLLKNINDRYDALARERQRIYDGLAATRKDRMDELRGGKENFLSLVASLQHSRTERDQQGKYAELSRLATIDIKNVLRKKVEFPDGTFNPVILDSETEFGDE